MTIGSLFAGIGGLELGLERAGLGPVVWQVEKDVQRRHWLANNWPNAERFDDVRTVGVANLAHVDIVCGGYPCRGISSAGPRNGFDHPETDLWSEMLRVVEEIGPLAVVVENVSGGVAWVERVCADLVEIGYSWRSATRAYLSRCARTTSALPCAARERSSWHATPTRTANQWAPSMRKWRGCRMTQDTWAGPSARAWTWLMGFPPNWLR
jgi:site-specific DNA-cytosine methylase